MNLHYLLLLCTGLLVLEQSAASSSPSSSSATKTATRNTPSSSSSSIVDDTATPACSQFKAPNARTPTNLKQKWEQDDRNLWKYVEQQVPAVLDHTGTEAFDHHLKGVQAVLRYWGAPDHLANAGLFHSIYGTEGFQGFSLPLAERQAIQQLIGKEAERLCFWFCMVDRSTLDQTVMDWDKPLEDNVQFTLRSRPELGRFALTLNKEEWLDFVELTIADWLEQVEGASTKPSDLFLWKKGEAYAYRRLAYAKMATILAAERPSGRSHHAQEMLAAVMGTEDLETRHLVQLRTPPMSEAAALALEALRASGETIPVDLSPQPHESLACSA
ncbi:unnamed protein product [Cylindrotheca closterium]|uniref:DUF6817 domain-containing protein n=1 Tax=Cylindrotheca closterium TaxID=2856 RepID=A0AAD2FQF8_9STRA|nr:unnamed protein product [Cylindrotheca closterium]